jgi:hypothetical protein
MSDVIDSETIGIDYIYSSITIMNNNYLLASAILLIILALAHSLFGEIGMINPLVKSKGVPAFRGSVRFTKDTMRFAWHITSILGLGFAAVILYYGTLDQLDDDERRVLEIFTITFAISFVVSLIGSRGKHPAWIAFLLIAIFTWLGMRE